MTPAAELAARNLLAQALHLKALSDHPAGVVPFGMGRAKQKLFALADTLESELAKPVEIKPWSLWGTRK